MAQERAKAGQWYTIGGLRFRWDGDDEMMISNLKANPDLKAEHLEACVKEFHAMCFPEAWLVGAPKASRDIVEKRFQPPKAR